jgi:hypothetical protein
MPYQHAFTIVILLLSKTNYEKTFQAFLEILFNRKILFNQLPAGCWEKATIAPAICHNKPNRLGRWCSWPFFINPNHTTRIVVAYRPCSTKVKGLKTVYQQQKRYMQREKIQGSPIEMFDRDLADQIKKWRNSGERVILLMDVNGDQ